ncbi:serine hydrolase [bacterium]|nr:serine hydrolase [bacterium]
MKKAERSILILTVFVLSLTITACSANADPFPWANPWDVGIEYEHVNRAFSEIAEAVKEKAAPGVVVMIVKDGKIVARHATGHSQTRLVFRSPETNKITYVPYSPRMLEMTVFDLASLTKMVATTVSMMILIEEGKINLDEKVTTYIPTFGARAKGNVTVRHLMTHSSGLPAWYPFHTFCIDREEVYRCIDEELSLKYPPGSKRIYSDLGFMMLGRLVETISGQRLDSFAQSRIYKPLSMNDTMFHPRLQERLRVAPTEYDLQRNKVLKGIVHDENARSMGGVSGHAGLFSTVNDLAVFAQMILNGGEFKGKRILKPETVKLMLTPHLNAAALENGSGFLRSRRQLLGWWGMDEEATVGDLGGLPSSTAFGHSGFTGTMLMIDPEHKTTAILLSNAVHPRREDSNRTALRRAFFVNISKALIGEEKVNVQRVKKQKKKN